MRHRAQHALLCLTLLATASIRAQESVPQFEVATLKLSPPPTGASISINLGTFQNGRFTFGNVTLNDAVQFAFDLPSKDLLVGVDWSGSVRFDVEAIAPRDTPPAQLRLMVRELLEERLPRRAQHRPAAGAGVDGGRAMTGGPRLTNSRESVVRVMRGPSSYTLRRASTGARSAS